MIAPIMAPATPNIVNKLAAEAIKSACFANNPVIILRSLNIIMIISSK